MELSVVNEGNGALLLYGARHAQAQVAAIFMLPLGSLIARHR